MKRRQLLQFAGFGTVGLLVSSGTRSSLADIANYKSLVQADLNLGSFDFDVATLNKAGKVWRSQTHSATFLPVSISSAKPLDMVSIFPGRFWMGSTKSESSGLAYDARRHRVNISPFFMSKYPITQSQWAAVSAWPKIHRDIPTDPSHFQGDDRPVESVSWLDAIEFCDRLSQHTGHRFQLPSESQWEYACRAGTQTPFHTGETIGSDYANYVGTYTYNAEVPGDYLQATVPVGRYKPNAFGLHDMHGNVWEWCADAWHRNYRHSLKLPSIDTGDRQPQMRAIRGGGWLDSPQNIRSASRSGYLEIALNRTIGFRVAIA